MTYPQDNEIAYVRLIIDLYESRLLDHDQARKIISNALYLNQTEEDVA